jgi:cytochrome c oxidase subunit III
LISSYFYLRATTDDWPPGDMPLPPLLVPTIATALMLASTIPTFLGDHAIKKGDRRGLIVNLIVTAALEVGFIALVVLHLGSLNFDWTKNSYASVYWILILSDLTVTILMVLENLYILVHAQRGFYNAERHWAVEVDGLSSYFVTATWLVVYATVFLSPYLI